MLLYIVFLSLGYHISKATNNDWCPSTSTLKEHILPRLKSQTTSGSLRLAEFLSKQTRVACMCGSQQAKHIHVLCRTSDKQSHTDKMLQCGLQVVRLQAFCVPTVPSTPQAFHFQILPLIIHYFCCF